MVAYLINLSKLIDRFYFKILFSYNLLKFKLIQIIKFFFFKYSIWKDIFSILGIFYLKGGGIVIKNLLLLAIKAIRLIAYILNRETTKCVIEAISDIPSDRHEDFLENLFKLPPDDVFEKLAKMCRDG